MNKNNLKDMILEWKIKSDKQKCLDIIEKFKPLLKKYSNKLTCEDSEQIMICKLIEVLKKIPIENGSFEEEKFILTYINNSIKNEYIYLKNKEMSEKYFKYDYEYDYESIDYNDNKYKIVENNIFLRQMLKVLNEKEKRIFKSRYIENRSMNDTAINLHRTRQCIYKHDKNIKEKLKRYFQEIV